MQPGSPTTGPQRLQLLDALRGFALAGVLLVNLRDLSLFGFLSEPARAALPTAGADYFFGLGMSAFVEKKAITIFTLLFGVGFAMQAQRAAESGEGMQRYARRLLILLVIGILHGVFWYSDVLRFYALMGLPLVPMARLKTRFLVWLGVLIALFSWPLLRPIMAPLARDSAAAPEMVAVAFEAFSGSGVFGMVQANISYDLWLKIAQWNLPLALLGRFLIGAAIGRSGVMRDPEMHFRFWSRLLAWLLPIGAAAAAFSVFHESAGLAAAREWWRTETATNLVRIAASAASLALGLAYVALFVLLFQRPAWRRWLNLFSPVGQMALTNYLFQTFAGLALFYGIGLGIGPRFGLAGTLILFFPLIFSAQIVFSHWWLARFQFGPLEWIWRCLTYGRWLGLRQPEVTNAPM